MLRALPLAVSTATRDVRGMVRRTKRNALLSASAGVCFGTAYVAGVAAIGIYFATVVGPAFSALAIAVAMAAAGGAVLLVLHVLKRRDRRRNAKRQAAQRLTAAAAISILPQLANRKSLLAVAALGGLAFLAAQASGDTDTD